MTPDSLLHVTLALKSATLAFLLLIAFAFARRRDRKGIVGFLFSVSIVSYVIASAFHGPAGMHIAVLPVRLGAATATFWFYLLCRVLFSDDYTPSRWLWCVPFSQAVIGLTVWFAWPVYADSVLISGLILTQQLLALGLLVAAIGVVQREGAEDLIEERRRLRRRFSTLVGGAAMVVVTLEVYLRGQCAPALFNAIQSAGVFGIVCLVAAYTLGLRGEFLEPPARPATPPPDSPEDRALEEKLLHFMRTERGYREESMTIRRLAARLDVPEYRLRRVINLRLAFRNFNEFLNRFRIDEAQAILSDPAQADVPILRMALDLGYGSLATFNRAFRARTGTTPTAYRRRSSD